MTNPLSGVWQDALHMVEHGWWVIPLERNDKRPIWEDWPNKGVATPEGVGKLAIEYPRHNYGMFRPGVAVLDIDLDKDLSATLASELGKLHDILGRFEPRFMQKTGRGGYHIPFYTHGREIHNQPLTDLSEIRGWHSQIVGAGSIHPETGRRYEICNGAEPSDITELSEDALDKLVRSKVEYEPQQLVMPEDVDEHPSCIQYLLGRGAPITRSKKTTEITYNDANLLLVDYAVARGYSDEQALSLAQEVALHTPANHPTSKGAGDKIANFRSALNTARSNPEKYQFACGYMLRSPAIKNNGCDSSCPNFKARITPLPPIPVVPTPEGKFSIERLLEANRKHLHIDEDYNVTIVPTVIIANQLQHDVDVVIIVGPSGSLKTELLRELGDDENQYIYPVSTITEHTLASGLVDNEDLAPRLRGRTLVIKDFTSILSKRDDVLGQIFADLRELTDGYIQKEYGSGAKKRHKGLHSSVLAASTNAIERYHSLFNTLGSRALLVRPINNSVEARKQGWANQKSLRIKEIREELHNEMFGFICSKITRLNEHPEEYQQLSDEDAEKIGSWCDSLAVLRTHIARDHKGRPLSEPEPEFPTRLMSSICKLTQVHAFVHRREPGPDDLNFARRLLYDNISTLRLRVLPFLSTEKTTTARVSQACGLGTDVVRHTLEDLVTLGVCNKTSRDSKDDGDKRYDDYWLSDPSYADFIDGVVNPVNSYKKELAKTFVNRVAAPASDDVPKSTLATNRGMQPVGTDTNIFSEDKKSEGIPGSLHPPHANRSQPTLLTDDDFLSKFRAMVGSFKVAGTQELKPQTRDTFPDYICKELADERAIHFDDVRARWDAVCHDKEIQRYLNEIFND